MAVLAPTGVAALNVKGQTIHPNSNSESIYQKLEVIVIDEISMVRADLLDCIDRFLRLNGPKPDEPFGGIQMAFIGNLYQLPLVVSGSEKEEVAACAARLKEMLEENSLMERKAFIKSFVKEVKVTGDDVLLTYTLPMLPERITEEKLPVLSIVHHGGR